jgi:ubiquinone/menaquinone biosynthesis C-methylase UbiE
MGATAIGSTLDVTAHLAGQGVRLGWYLALNRLLDWRADSLGQRPTYKPQRPVPDMRALLADLGQLLLADAAAVRDGVFPPMADDGVSLREHLARVGAMFADLPEALRRRAEDDAGSVRTAQPTEGLPEYFTQDFHFQTGGYLTDESARLYDVQVETLFMGSAGPMRRAALQPIADAIRSRDQRRMALLDVACGTGRFLRQVRLAYPALRLTGLDLSGAYLDEAARHFAGLRAARWLVANAEAPPLADASQDIVTCIFLFHELPPEVRRQVAREIARVLKPGGTFVFIDSLQFGDKPGWDGLIEAFPVRFHEPYYRHYAIDDLESLFAAAGLHLRTQSLPFLAKMMVFERAGD